jgi:hypothetical protein
MPTLKSALVQRLLDAPAVSAIVGTKIKWNAITQSTALPYVRLQIISDPRPINLKGYDGSRETRVQADCFAATNIQADAIAAAIIATILAPTPPAAGGHFGRTKALGPQDLGEDVEGKPFIHRASLDLLVRHTFS